MGKKTLLFLGAGIAFISFAGFAIKKKERIEHIVDKLQFKLVSVKNFKFSFKQFSMDLVIRAVNPTSEDLSINTGFIKAKVLRVYEKKTGKLLAFSNLDTSKINLPSGGFFDLPSVYVEIPSLTGAQYLLNELSGKDKQNLIEKFSFELDVSALGKTQTIKF
ncbi:hypothetical protein PL373_09255 [Tenacibaculum maritimum]|nr:hypothetical protein [Tenacibaculum maritimum]MDB0601331.1 hypothetical protein [Tenacibaculum maritimum]MDB0611752.1 hypothetical protein [Tenacibaculum maritimum]